jgi:hypothetical protein
MMTIIHTWQLERKGYAIRMVDPATLVRHEPQMGKAPRPENPMRRLQLSLLGSNQDSPNPEGPP